MLRMKRQGTLIRWEKERGFGFIRSPDTSADVFVHLRDFMDRRTMPQVGMTLDFEEIHMGSKGPRAVAVQLAGAVRQRARQTSPARKPHKRSGRGTEPATTSSSLPMVLILTAYLSLIGYGMWNGRIPPMILGLWTVLNLLAFFVYKFDKNAAETGRWRTAESTLHLISLLGGWLGAWCAQRLFRHKIRKTSFMVRYWITVFAHAMAAGAWAGKFLPAGLPAL